MAIADLLPHDERIVFLSIDGEHADALLDGRKQYEFRTGPPGIDPPYTAVLYATAPRAEIPGLVHVAEHVEGSPAELARLTNSDVPQSAGTVASYLQGGRKPTALKIGTKAEISMPITRLEAASHWKEGFIPQNFRYLDSHDLIEECRSRVVRYLGGKTRRCRHWHTDPDCYRLNRKNRDPHVATPSEIIWHEIDHCPNCNPKDTENNQEGENTGESPLAKQST